MNLSQKDKALVAFLIILVLGFAFYRLVYSPLNKEIQNIANHNRQLQMEKDRLENKKDPASQEAAEDTADNFVHFDKRLPSEAELIPLLTLLDETADKYDLPLATLDFKGEDKVNEREVQTLVLNITTKGKIMQLLSFLRDLENEERLISVENISFNGVKAEAINNEDQGREPGPPTYYIEPPEIPEGKLKRIKFEIEEEPETPSEIERFMADSFMPDSFEMKMTIKTYSLVQSSEEAADKADDKEKSNRS